MEHELTIYSYEKWMKHANFFMENISQQFNGNKMKFILNRNCTKKGEHLYSLNVKCWYVVVELTIRIEH